MILDPVIRVMCDDCGNEEEFPMTFTARGGYDDRELEGWLNRWGWTIAGQNTHYCEECSRERERGEEEEEEREDE